MTSKKSMGVKGHRGQLKAQLFPPTAKHTQAHLFAIKIDPKQNDEDRGNGMIIKVIRSCMPPVPVLRSFGTGPQRNFAVKKL